MSLNDILSGYAVEAKVIVPEKKFDFSGMDDSFEAAEADWRTLVDSQSEMFRGMAAMESIQILSAGFFKDPASFTEETARLHQVSVESVIRAAKLSIPVAMLAPSFESASQYTAESNEKKSNVLIRFWRWLKALIANLARAIAGFFKRTKFIFANVEKDFDKMEAMLKRIKADGSKTETKTINYPDSVNGAVDNGKPKSSADVAKDVTLMREFMDRIGTGIEKISKYEGGGKAVDVLKSCDIQPGKVAFTTNSDLILDTSAEWSHGKEQQSAGFAGPLMGVDDMLGIIGHLKKMLVAVTLSGERVMKAVDKVESQLFADAKAADEKYNSILNANSKEEGNKILDEWLAMISNKVGPETMVAYGSGAGFAMKAATHYCQDWRRVLQTNISSYKVKATAEDEKADKE